LLTVYPSNKLEDLVQILPKLLSLSSENILQAQTIITESQGMEHWLKLQLAKQQGIYMNINFKMPSSYLWDIARSIDDNEDIPRHSPYQRDILSWRIDKIIHEAGDSLADIYRYCCDQNQHPAPLKRFQFSSSLADIFEQYILYRQGLLFRWQNNEINDGEQWQATIWQQLVQQDDYNPVKLQQHILQQLRNKKHQAKLPQQVIIFAINTLAPQILTFFETLAEFCHIHLLHLNPCAQFWGEIQSDKSKAKQLRHNNIQTWMKQDDTISNSLLANLGQQGKEFFNLILKTKHHEIGVFDLPDNNDTAEKSSILLTLQNDILTLYNRTLTNKKQELAEFAHDNSIVINSCHSALREIQVLHDYLLSQFEQDPNLKPHDILVMCPCIEDYAPYINAVFQTSFFSDNESYTSRLKCTLSDRSIKDADPLIAIFLDLLQLPDSRFEVSKILDYIRLPAMQQKFGFNDSELDTIVWWLDQASIHWGVNLQHKTTIADLENTSEMFTWQWGLQRLLLGFSYADQEVFVNDKLLLPHIEGQEIVLLGRLMQLIEQLQYHRKKLNKARNIEDWHQYLFDEFIDQFFSFKEADKVSLLMLKNALQTMKENVKSAQYDEEIKLEVIRCYLQQQFSLTDNNNRFLAGQISFCSMIPMRSIPFKIIAILGLNDGVFPRQEHGYSYGLLKQHPPQEGDRSRRGDDRYLFLEAILSAREKFYLSYQGRDEKKNTPRQSSLILKEFIAYLQQGFGWRNDDKNSQIIQHPLHPFNALCYQGTNPSFDKRWFRFIQAGTSRNNLISFPPIESEGLLIQANDMIKFFTHPLKVFAQHSLALYFEDNSLLLEDKEPFASNALTDYQIRFEISQKQIKNEKTTEVFNRYLHSGQLADSALVEDELLNMQEALSPFASSVKAKGSFNTCYVELKLNSITLTAELPLLAQNNKLVAQNKKLENNTTEMFFWRPSSRKAKDDLQLWLMHLIANASLKQEVTSYGLYFNHKTNKQESVFFPAIKDKKLANSFLQHFVDSYLQGLSTPSLNFVDFGKVLFSKKEKLDVTQISYQQASEWEKYINTSLQADDYFAWFYPQSVALTTELYLPLSKLFQPLYAHLQVEK